jgi:hypothetical protein
MATLRKHRNKWQSIVRVQGHPTLCKSFISRTDAKRWATEAEIKIRREDAGVAKMHFPKFEDVARKYIDTSSIYLLRLFKLFKECFSIFVLCNQLFYFCNCHKAL